MQWNYSLNKTDLRKIVRKLIAYILMNQNSVRQKEKLTQCGLATPYGVLELSQQSFC